MTLLESTGSRKPLYIALIALLLLTNGYLLYKSNDASKEVGALLVSNEQLDKEKRALQLDYTETVKNLDALKVEKTNLNGSIFALNERVEEQKSELSGLLRKNKLSKVELDEVKARLYTLQLDAENYRRTVALLQQENEELSVRNVTLVTNLENETAKSTLLESANEELQTTKTNLTEENGMLAAKVAKGEILVTDNVEATGVKFKASGKEVSTSNARKAEKLKVCFDAMANRVTEPGKQEVLVRIISPEGSPISVQSLGSGTFQVADSEKQMNYTTKADINFQGDPQSYCIYWEQDQEYMDGTYAAELYHKESLIGKTNFDLRKGIL